VPGGIGPILLNISAVGIYHVVVRLSEPALLVLAAVAEKPRHGYALLDELDRSGVRVRTGSLYAILDRLRRAGLIEVDHDEIVASRLRRYYRITGAGVRRLAAHARSDTAAGVLRRLGLGGAS
jgi:PadR family transcriptional regulator, regulatory protein PadR